MGTSPEEEEEVETCGDGCDELSGDGKEAVVDGVAADDGYCIELEPVEEAASGDTSGSLVTDWESGVSG